MAVIVINEATALASEHINTVSVALKDVLTQNLGVLKAGSSVVAEIIVGSATRTPKFPAIFIVHLRTADEVSSSRQRTLQMRFRIYCYERSSKDEATLATNVQQLADRIKATLYYNRHRQPDSLWADLFVEDTMIPESSFLDGGTGFIRGAQLEVRIPYLVAHPQ